MTVIIGLKREAPHERETLMTEIEGIRAHKFSELASKITPEAAAQLQTYNTGNFRPKSAQTIRAYRNDMEAGQWHDSGDCIIIAGTLNGRGANRPIILNGQNRLQAIIDSGVTVEVIVLEGFRPPDALAMDAGKRRKLDDYLRREQYSYPLDLSAIIRLSWAYDHELLTSKHKYSASHQSLFSYFDDHPELVDHTIVAASWKRRLTFGWTSVFGTARYVIGKLDDDEALDELEDFFDHVIAAHSKRYDGPPITTSNVDPRFVYGRTLKGLLSDAGRGGSQREHLALLFKAWNAYRSGTEIGNLAWRASRRSKEAFPIPR